MCDFVGLAFNKERNCVVRQDIVKILLSFGLSPHSPFLVNIFGLLSLLFFQGCPASPLLLSQKSPFSSSPWSVYSSRRVVVESQLAKPFLSHTTHPCYNSIILNVCLWLVAF
jgi:hypothetical protein